VTDASILPLEVERVSWRAGSETLVHELSFTLEAGPCTVVLGPNGAGKSLSLRLCHGLIRPTSGRVRWQGRDPSRRQAMVFQRPVMLRRTALANVEYALGLRGVARAERRRRALDALARTGLAALGGRAANALSYGEQQRLALARAWALEPEVLFLDDPTSSLDPAASHAVEGIVCAIGEAGAKIVLTTHDLALARRMAGDVIFLHRGRLLERGPAESFFSRPSTEEARAFLKGELYW